MEGLLSAQKRQHQKSFARPPGLLLHRAAALEPAIGLGLVAALDRKRAQAVVAGHQQLRLADSLGELERLGVVAPARFGVAAALVDLREDDQRHGEVATL